MRVEGLRALVIGGGGAGIGRAITQAYAEQGAAVAVADIDRDRAEEAADAVRAAGRPRRPWSGRTTNSRRGRPRHRRGRPAGQDVAEAAVYLASPGSAYVTGQRIVVDGGVSVRGPIS